MRFATQAVTAAAAVGVAVAASSAFTAGNTATPVVSVGQASTVTSGYTVGGVDYTLSSGASGAAVSITAVAFTLAPDGGGEAPTEARVRLVSTLGYSTCTVGALASGSYPVSCTGLSVLASAADTLDIVASSR